MADNEVLVHKVTLGSKKVVLLRELKIKHQELAAQAAGATQSSDNEIVMGIAVQKELLKLLIVSVNDKEVKPGELEDLDANFSYQEYTQLMSVLTKLVGGKSDAGNFTLELVTSGST